MKVAVFGAGTMGSGCLLYTSGLHVVAADSDGNTYDNPHCLIHSEKRLAREQRKLSRMRKGSANYEDVYKRQATHFSLGAKVSSAT